MTLGIGFLKLIITKDAKPFFCIILIVKLMMTLYVQEENYNDAVSLLHRESQRYVENHRRPPGKIGNHSRVSKTHGK